MKQILRGWFSSNRTERLGIALLSFILLLLIVIRCTLAFWVKPASIDEAEQAKMATLYQDWKSKQASAQNPSGEGFAGNGVATGSLFSFDPNTLDSDGFIRLGMSAKAVKGLLNWRRHGKHFYKTEDLKPLYNLPPETYARLEPFVQIAEKDKPSFSGSGFANKFPALPDIIDLNTADSAQLDRGIKGIGATLAHKIIARRTALGGFVRHEQLLEIYKFPDSTFQQMKAHLSIHPETVKKMNLNAVNLEQLSLHPYIGEKLAKNIILFREGIKSYQNIAQLRQAPLMTEEIYRKIAPYFSIGTAE